MAGAASAFVVSAAQFPTIPVLLLIIEQSLQCTSVHGKDAHFSDLPVRFALVHLQSSPRFPHHTPPPSLVLATHALRRMPSRWDFGAMLT